jgi:hypothetical protein
MIVNLDEIDGGRLDRTLADNAGGLLLCHARTGDLGGERRTRTLISGSVIPRRLLGGYVAGQVAAAAWRGLPTGLGRTDRRFCRFRACAGR